MAPPDYDENYQLNEVPPYILRCFTNAAPIHIADYQAPYADAIWADETFPRVADLPTLDELANFVTDFTKPGTVMGDWGISFCPFGYITYRVVFQSLTNYLDHAPAR